MRVLTRIVDWFAMPYSLYLVLRDPQLNWKAKLKAGLILVAVAIYILNPMDIIPDVTPFWGWIDDLLVIPAVMAVSAKIIPEVNVAEIRQKARATGRRVIFWTILFISFLVLISLSTLGLLIFLAIRAWS